MADVLTTYSNHEGFPGGVEPSDPFVLKTDNLTHITILFPGSQELQLIVERHLISFAIIMSQDKPLTGSSFAS